MVNIIINPGSGPVDGATEANATKNIKAFVDDLCERGLDVDYSYRRLLADADGRYGFGVRFGDGRVVEVDMPGLPLDKVRYMKEPGQDIWDFPRLYVDGSSWIWCFALGVCRPHDEDEGL